MVRQRNVKVRTSRGEIRECSLFMSTAEPYFLELVDFRPDRLHADGDDLFDCLAKLRLELASEAAMALCNGARLDTFPSGMAREMSGGRKVYLLRMGQPARPQDLVNTFDEAPIDKIASVSEQQAYYLDWLASCK